MVDAKIPTGGTTVGYDDLLQISVPEETRTQRTSPNDLFRSSSTDWITVEHFTGENAADFFQSIAFPQREQLARFTTNSI